MSREPIAPADGLPNPGSFVPGTRGSAVDAFIELSPGRQARAPSRSPYIRVNVTHMKLRTRPRRYEMKSRADAAALTHQRIIDAAVQLVSERDFEAIGLSEIAKEAGVTVQTVLRRFGSKEGLFAAASETGREQVRAQRWAAPEGDVAAAVKGLIEHYEAWGERSLHFLAQAPRSAAMKQLTVSGKQLHTEWVEHTFKPWLAARRSPAVRARLRAKLIAITDVYTWSIFRKDLRMDRDATELTVRELVDATLA